VPHRKGSSGCRKPGLLHVTCPVHSERLTFALQQGDLNGRQLRELKDQVDARRASSNDDDMLLSHRRLPVLLRTCQTE